MILSIFLSAQRVIIEDLVGRISSINIISIILSVSFFDFFFRFLSFSFFWGDFLSSILNNFKKGETWAHVHEFRPSCPDLYCLGDTCRFPTYDCGNQWGNCRDEGLEVATEENCPVEVSACNTNAPVSSCDGSFVCAYCPETGPCIEAEGVTTEAECNQLKACYFPDNSMQIGVTEQQCLTVAGKCSEPCYGQSCRPAFAEYQKGVCQLDIPQDWLGCQRYGGGVYSGRPYGTNFPFVWSECLLTAVRTEQECLQVFLILLFLLFASYFLLKKNILFFLTDSRSYFMAHLW